MKITVIYSNEYNHIAVEAERFSLRQWENGDAELCFEYADGSFATHIVNSIKTINVCEIASMAQTNLDLTCRCHSGSGR